MSQTVFIGLRRGEKHPLVAVWTKLEDDKLTEKRFSFSTKGKKSILGGDAFIGDIYDFEEDGETCRVLGSRVGQWEDAAQRAEWKLEDANAKAQVSLDKTAAKENYGSLTLDTVREHYRKQIGRDRRNAFLACILQHITG